MTNAPAQAAARTIPLAQTAILPQPVCCARKRILMIVGSLREGSLNLQLAQEAAALLRAHAEIFFLDYAGIPGLDQNADFPPAEVQRVRTEVFLADGLWFFTPEYHSSYPGVLKNLLDWLAMDHSPLEGRFSARYGHPGQKGRYQRRKRQVCCQLRAAKADGAAQSDPGHSHGGAADRRSPEHESPCQRQADAVAPGTDGAWKSGGGIPALPGGNRLSGGALAGSPLSILRTRGFCAVSFCEPPTGQTAPADRAGSAGSAGWPTGSR